MEIRHLCVTKGPWTSDFSLFMDVKILSCYSISTGTQNDIVPKLFVCELFSFTKVKVFSKTTYE